MSLPTVWITRPLQEGEQLASLLTQLPCSSTLVPCVEMVEQSFQMPDLEEVDIAILVSKPSILYGVAKLNQSIPNSVQWLAVGQSTAELASHYINTEILVPSEQNSKGLLKLDVLEQVRHQKILIIKGKGGRNLLINALNDRGADVDEIDVYRRVVPENLAESLVSLWPEKRPQLVLITSCEILQNLYDRTPSAYKEHLLTTDLIVASERIEKFAYSLGFKSNITNAGYAENIEMAKSVLNYIQTQ